MFANIEATLVEQTLHWLVAPEARQGGLKRRMQISQKFVTYDLAGLAPHGADLTLADD